MFGSDHKENRNNEYPRMSEDDWYVLAIVFSIITLVAAGFALWWIFHGDFPYRIADRATIAGMVVTFGGVVTTFCTVAWRGMIAAQQTKISNEQLVASQQQLLLVQQNNLATILQKGAEYLEELDNKSKISAGIASLHSVMLSENEGFSKSAHSLLWDFLEKHGKSSHKDNNVKLVINHINKFFDDNKNIVIKVIKFKNDEVNLDGFSVDSWILLRGVLDVTYIGGEFFVDDFEYRPSCSLLFVNVKFDLCTFKSITNMTFKNCTFETCTFEKVDTAFLETGIFRNCDFSFAEIKINSSLRDLRAGKNYYEGTKPIAISKNTSSEVDWSLYFLNKTTQ